MVFLVSVVEFVRPRSGKFASDLVPLERLIEIVLLFQKVQSQPNWIIP